ncbi:uncharacterized protein LOC136070972 [Quercus suber]|uniref:uncharacterized protein LOC136070972 n=1 Tax=Quercus suber TaxID=58331 RepID=UPI0032DFB8C8
MADPKKAREELKEMIRAKNSVVSGLDGAQKQAEVQTERLLEAEGQLQIAKEQITNLKKKLAEAEGAKNAAEWARDETRRGKEEAEFTKTEAETSKEKAEKVACDLGVAETQALFKSQIPGVCRLYYSQVWNEALKQAGVKASSNLWKVENVYYPPAIMESAPSSSETEVAPEEAKAAQLEAALAMTTPNKPTEEGEFSRAKETSEGRTLKSPRKPQSLQPMLRPFKPRSQPS